MQTKPSGEIKVRIVNCTQKNGDIYVLERRTIYDPEKKCNKVLSSRLLSKIPKGSQIPVPTRPKRRKDAKSADSAPALSASREHVGMMEIIDHIGKVSGIDGSIYSHTDEGTAQKILSLARYLLAANGQSLPGIYTWQFNHPLPYQEGMSEDIYHDLFEKIGRDESLQQNFFKDRCTGILDRAVLGYDSTTVSTYSKNQPEARYGFNKADDGLKAIKVLTLYSLETRQPIAFTKQAGNLPDVITIANALKELSVLGLSGAEIVTDNGYYSEGNLAELFLASFDFITLVKTNIKWVRQELDSRMDAFDSISSVCPFDTSTHGITTMLMRTFDKLRKYASHKSGVQKGDSEPFRRRVYLHFYFNPVRKAEEDVAFDHDLIEMKSMLEKGIPVEALSESGQNKAKKYLSFRKRGSKTTVSFNEEACRTAKRRHGYFALISNCEKDAFECLRKYRKRETIEFFFESMKQRTDSSRTRVWDTDTLRGRMFVQFVALCYYEYLGNEIRKMRETLGETTGDPAHDTKAILQLEEKLKTWLSNTPVYLVLQWFDVVDSVKISSTLRSKRWRTEVTQRDSLFLNKLGLSTL